jgi:membrane-associated protein
LLVLAGLVAAVGAKSDLDVSINLGVVLVGLFISATAGAQTGYFIGRKAGPALFKRPDSRFFKKENLDKASAYFDRHGPKTIVLARYVPIVRTFAPIVAGASGMQYRTFVRFNVLGGAAWALVVPLLGYYLGQIDVIAENIELAIIAVVAISILPMVVEVLRHRRAAKAAVAAE